MAFNGSGVFVRLYSWVNDAAANIKIRADRMDNEMNGFSTGLSTCITKDGQTTITNNLPMAGFRHTGVGAGNSRTDYTRLDQAQDGKLAWVDGGGTADAITASYTIPITAPTEGQLCCVRATAANSTTTPTFAPNGSTARTIVKNGGQALVAGDIAGDGHELELRYDLANTRWELMNPRVTSIATGVTFPTTGILATLAGTETLTNKTLTTPIISGRTDGGSASAGNVGEVISSTVLSGAAVSLALSGTVYNITSILLSAGNWNITAGTGILTGASVITTALSSTNTTSGVMATPPNSGSYAQATGNGASGSNIYMSLGARQYNVSSPTTVYLVAQVAYSGAAPGGYGYIQAERRQS